MVKKSIAVLISTLLLQVVYADTCPNVKDIKSKTLIDWKAYDSDDGMPLSPIREAQFKKTIEEFVLAEWANEKNNSGTMHCYYRDATGSSLEAYLAKDNFVPQNQKKYWYEVSGYLHCAAGMDKCEFDRHILEKTKQLARK